MMVTLSDLHSALGGVITSGAVRCPGPGHSHRDRSLVVRPSEGNRLGFVAYSWSGDEWPEIRDHICGRLGIDAGKPSGETGPTDPLERVQRRAEAAAAEKAHAARRQRRAASIWREAIGLPCTIAEAYLASRAIPAEVMLTPVLRFHPNCPFGEERHPCLVALMSSVETGEPVAIHRTALTKDGRKIDRKMLGPTGGAAIMLGEATNEVVIGEGIETCLSAGPLGIRGPTWAMGSADAIGRLPVLGAVQRITLLEELGDSGASARAVLSCGSRWQTAGRSVRVIRPRVGSDLNDELRSRAQ